MVEEALKRGGFEKADAYRYNLASIRIRVIEERFEGLLHGERVDRIEPILETFPEQTARDVIELWLFTPQELQESTMTLGDFLRNTEFEEPSPSEL